MIEAIPLSAKDEQLYAVLVRAAESGQPCPGNTELAGRFGWDSIASPVRRMQKLEKAGRITVERGHHTRVVTIVATGQRTAGAAVRSQRVRVSGPRRRSKPSEEQAPTVTSDDRWPKISRLPDFGFWRPKQCQWIEGQPTRDDSCKCLAPVRPGQPYCEAHYRRAWRAAA